jgi:hypothetical protein
LELISNYAFDINLATRPYEDAREFWARWGLGVGLLAVLTLVLLGWTVRGWTNAGRDRQRSRNCSSRLRSATTNAPGAGLLDLAANRSTRDQSQFLNGLIQRKAFSWTRVFEDLEQVMPPNLHVVSLRPELNEQNQMELEMKVAGDARRRGRTGPSHGRLEAFQGAQLVQGEGGGERAGRSVAAMISIYVPDRDSRSEGSGK